MAMDKDQAAAYAHGLGFDDIRFADINVPLLPFAASAQLLENASCIAVLFKAYHAANTAPAGYVPLSPYYTAAHFSYHAAKAFASYIDVRGYQTLYTSALDAKAAALRTGGFIGDNGFYYHPALGSLVCIQTVMTTAFLPDKPAVDHSECLHCGACMRACPSGGVNNLSRCLRRYSDKLIPTFLRGDVYQLLGCEKCQTVCPKNPQNKIKPHVFAIDEALNGACIDTLKNLAGVNMARSRRIASHTALYAANTRQHQLLPQLLDLAENADEPLRSHARWACGQMNGDTIHDQA